MINKQDFYAMPRRKPLAQKEVIATALRRPDNGEEETLGFGKYLLEKKWVLLLAVGGALLLSWAYVKLLAKPRYEATTYLYVINHQDALVDLSDLEIGSYLKNDYQIIFQMWEVNQAVIDQLSLPYTQEEMLRRLKVTNLYNTRVLSITFQSESSREAAEVANAYAEVGSSFIAQTMKTTAPTILSRAQTPKSPVYPRQASFIGGCVLLVSSAVLWLLYVFYLYDDKIKTLEDFRGLMRGTPQAVIPAGDDFYAGGGRK